MFGGLGIRGHALPKARLSSFMCLLSVIQGSRFN